MNTLQIILFVILGIGIITILLRTSEGFTISENACKKRESQLLNRLNASVTSQEKHKGENITKSSHEQRTNNVLKKDKRDNGSCLPTDICDKPGMFHEVNSNEGDIHSTPPDFFNDKRNGFFIYEDDTNDHQL